MKKFIPILFIIMTIQANLCLAQDRDEKAGLETGDKIRQVFDLAKDPRIRGELEIVDFQVEKLETLKTEYLDRIQKMNAEAKTLSGERDDKLASKKWAEIQTSTIKEIEQILLPHQIRRLGQLARQNPIKFVARGDRFKMYIVMANQLDLSGEEIEAFKKNVMKEKQEYEKKMRELMSETDKSVRQHLPKKARAKYNELFGEIF